LGKRRFGYLTRKSELQKGEIERKKKVGKTNIARGGKTCAAEKRRISKGGGLTPTRENLNGLRGEKAGGAIESQSFSIP